MSIFELINVNINTLNENVHTLMQQVANTQQEVLALAQMFKAPEQPNVLPGGEGAKTEQVGEANKPTGL